MSRLFWMGLGAAIGVMATRRVNRAARHLTPGGLADDVGDALRQLAGAVGSFGADVRAGMAEREHELHRMVDDRTGIRTGHDDGNDDGNGYGAGRTADNGAATARVRARRAAD